MSALDWLVIGLGVSAIIWVNWYFFRARRPAALAVAGAGGTPQVTITVRGGYDPSEIRVPAGRPVRLIFDRQETSGCSEEVVFPDFGIRRFLPAHQQTAIELTAPAAGRYGFTCGMSMLRGTLVAE